MAEIENELIFVRVLNDIANTTDAGAQLELGVWFSVPGGIISGNLCSYNAFVGVFLDNFPLGDGRRKIQEVVFDQDGKLSGRNRDTAYLVDATIVAGSRIIKVPFAQINITNIAAWGVGRYEPELTVETLISYAAHRFKE